jgi:hypothetical protein
MNCHYVKERNHDLKMAAPQHSSGGTKNLKTIGDDNWSSGRDMEAKVL